MSLGLAPRLALREMRGGLKGFRILLLCLMLGVAAIAAIGSVRAAIEAGIRAEGAALLGGDAEIELTYRYATAEEREWMDAKALGVSQIVDFRSMAVRIRDGETERALTQVKSVDDAYPLVGQVTLEPDIRLDEALAGTNTQPGAIVARALADRLGLSVGNTFQLGTQSFVVTALLTGEPDDAGASFLLGPRTIVSTDALAESGLLAPGTLFTTKYRLTLPPETDLERVSSEAKDRFANAGLRWRDSRDGAPGISEFVERLGAFLVLVGLSGLAVGGIGVSSAVRAFVAARTETIAILRSLGADRRTVFRVYALQISALAFVGIALGLVLGAILPIAIAPLIESTLPVPAYFGLYWKPLGEAALYGALAAALFALWPLARTEDVRAAALFRDAFDAAPSLPAFRHLAASAVLLALLVGSAAWFSGSVRLTLWTTGGISGALVALALVAYFARWVAKLSSGRVRGRPALRWALGAIAGPREAVVQTVIALGLGLTVLAAVGQIDGNLRRAISGNLPDVAPSYFFVDIQKDQMPGFEARLAEDRGVSRVESAPMLRGVITRINDRPAEEVAPGHWVLQGDRGVTYSAIPTPQTRITSGSWWPKDYAGPPQISFAAEEGTEMGLKLGDKLTVNILGRDITAEITSFREVDFSTAGIGFILSMNPSALAGAPHSFIATVYADEAAETAILRDLAGKFPNITAIRVRDAIDRVSDLLGGIASAVSYGAAATLLTGFLVLIGAAATGQEARIHEAAILKTLGATRARILRSIALRAGFAGLAAGSVALLAGAAGGWAVCYFVLETEFAVIWPNAIAIVAGGVLASIATALIFAAAPLRARPAQVLRGRE